MEGIPLKLPISPERLRWSIAAGASSLIALLCAAPVASAASNEVIVRFAPTTTVDAGSALVQAAGGHVTRRLEIIDGVGAVLDTSEVSALRADPRVVSVTPNASVAPKSLTDGVDVADAAAPSTPAPDWS